VNLPNDVNIGAVGSTNVVMDWKTVYQRNTAGNGVCHLLVGSEKMSDSQTNNSYLRIQIIEVASYEFQ